MSNYRTFQSVAVNAGCRSHEPKKFYGLSFQLLQVFKANAAVKMLVEKKQSDSNLNQNSFLSKFCEKQLLF